MLIDELHKKKKQLLDIVHKYGASDIKVFGSVARGEEEQNSDVDLLVSLPRGYDMFNQRMPMQIELEHVIGKTVDLVIQHEINKHLSVAILEEAREL